MIFHSPGRKLTEPIIIWFGRKKIQREKCVKFLGILLDANLNCRHDISELSKKLSRTTLYYSLCYSLLLYGIAVWGFTYKSYVQKLAVIQQAIVRVVTF